MEDYNIFFDINKYDKQFVENLFFISLEATDKERVYKVKDMNLVYLYYNSNYLNFDFEIIKKSKEIYIKLI